MKLKNIEKMEKHIDELELADMSIHEVNRVVKAFSNEGVKLRAARKKVRYSLYRLRSEAEGKCASDVDESFRKSFEVQPGFTGWRFFATNWDVAMQDPYEVVSRDLSEQEEWDNVVRSKFPQILPGGKVVYPDLKVKQQVDAEAARREK